MLVELQGYPLLLVIVGGVLSVFSPCCVSMLPIVIGVLSKDKKKDWKVSIFYSVGFMISVGFVGILVSRIGIFLQGYVFGSWYSYVLAILLWVIGLHFLGLLRIWDTFHIKFSFSKKSAFLFGLWCGVFSTPCATAIWVLVLSIISMSSIGWVYGFIYGFVHGVVYIVLAYAYVVWGVSLKKKKWYHLIEKGIGVLLIAWGIRLLL